MKEDIITRDFFFFFFIPTLHGRRAPQAQQCGDARAISDVARENNRRSFAAFHDAAQSNYCG